jgi:hypothetical protein
MDFKVREGGKMREQESIALMNQKSRESDIRHQAKMDLIVEQQEYNLFKILKPTVSIDGNQYCVLLGKNPMEGVVGFGDTLYEAILDFNKSFHLPIEYQKEVPNEPRQDSKRA